MFGALSSRKNLRRLFEVSLLACFIAAQTGCALQPSETLSSKKSPSNRTQGMGTVVFGMLWEPIGFNPIRNIDSGSYYAQTLVYEGLVRYDAELKIVPALAESFEIDPDQLTYSFRLRKNLRFSDGSPLTNSDVLASYQRAVSAGSPFKADFEDIDSCEIRGADQFAFRLKKINAAFLSRLVELRILPSRIFATTSGAKANLSRSL